MEMIDIMNKGITQREAVVEGIVFLKPKVISAIKKRSLPKGDVLAAAKIAGILAAKKTQQLIPLCHPIAIEFIRINFSLGKREIKITSVVRAKAKTGVEMEAFTAVAVCALTIYDMCKALDRTAVISEIKLLKKSGGKSANFIRKKP